MAGVVSDEEESSASTRVRDEDMQDVVLGEREDIILPAETLSSNGACFAEFASVSSLQQVRVGERQNVCSSIL